MGSDRILTALFFCDTFRRINSGEAVPSELLLIFTDFLVKNAIGFETSYSPGTRKEEAAMEINIAISPAASLNFKVKLGGYK